MSATKIFKKDSTSNKSEETLIKMNKFKSKLNEYQKILVKKEFDFNNPKEYIYDECADLRRRIQLYTEETIAEIKTKHNFHIDTDESDLNNDLRSLVDGVKEQSDSMIATVDKYEKETNDLFVNNELKIEKWTKEFRKSKKLAISKNFVSHWKVCLDEFAFDDQKMNYAALNLDKYLYELNQATRQYDLRIFDYNILKLKMFEPKKEFHLNFSIFIEQKCHWIESKKFKFNLIRKISQLDFSSGFCVQKFAKLSDGNYLIILVSGNFRMLYYINH